MECGLSIHEIANKINRSRKVISNFLRNPHGYGNNMKGRKSSVVSSVYKRAILRYASNWNDSAAKIKEISGVIASFSTVKRVISKAGHLKCHKLKKKKEGLSSALRRSNTLADPTFS